MGFLNRIFKESKEANTKSQADLDKLKQKERNQQNKLWDKDYYGSEESKIVANEIKEEKREYLENNPNDFLTRAVYLYGLTWDYVDRLSNDEIKILELAGKGLYFENDLNQYEEAIKIYNEADELAMVVQKEEIEQLTKEYGEGDYLFTGKVRQRISICENKIFRNQIKELEAEAKEMEKTNPQEAINKYEHLNEINPGLKKYNKRIEIIKRTLD